MDAHQFAYTYDRIDPFRRAASRWERAYILILYGDPLHPQRDDSLTALVYDYRRLISDGTCPRKCPDPRFRLLHKAHRVCAENSEARWELEARLLAGQSIREIARRLGVSHEFVSLFEQVFCTCRDRLKASDWVLFTFIGNGPMIGFAKNDMGGIWRWLGYFGGPYLLDLVIAATSVQPRRHSYPEEALKSVRRVVELAQSPIKTPFATQAETKKKSGRRAGAGSSTKKPNPTTDFLATYLRDAKSSKTSAPSRGNPESVVQP